MVLTVEPGIYISPSDALVPEKYRGIGIRIEDDVLTTAAEPLVITGDIPKTVSAVESAMAEDFVWERWQNAFTPYGYQREYPAPRIPPVTEGQA